MEESLKISLETVPLNEAQRGVYIECMENPGTMMYNIAFSLPLPASVDGARFTAAVEKVAAGHPALSAVFRMQDGVPVMLTGVTEPRVLMAFASSAEEAGNALIRPFDLENGPLCRLELCSTPEGLVFLFDVHHLVFDGTSVSIFLRQIAAAYDGMDIPPEKTTLAGFAAWESAMKQDEGYKAAQAFFKERFDGRDFDPALMPDGSSPGTGSRADWLIMKAPSELSLDEVGRFTSNLGVRESALFLGAFAYTLSIFSGSSESCFATVSAGRHGCDLSETVGMFVKTVPLIYSIDSSMPVSEYLKEIQSVFHSSIKNSCISFGELVADYGVNADISFAYQLGLLSEVEIDGVPALPFELPVGECPSSILCMVSRLASGYEARIQYRSERYTRPFVESFAETMFEIAKGMLTCPTLGDIDLVSEEGRSFISGFNSTETGFDASLTVNAVFEKTVKNHPDDTALVYRDRQYTFSQLDAVTRRIAAYIAAKGIGADDFVAVLAPRNDETVFAAWGVIRAGAAYQPLDPEYPPERLNYMVSDSAAKLLISDRSLRPLLDGYKGEVLYTDEFASLPDPAFSAAASPEDALAIIYTSGTTGNPKGCVLENRNLTAFFLNHTAVMKIDASSRIASYASFGFDAGVMDVVTTPMAGAALYIIPDEIRLDLAKVDEFYCSNGITHGFMTTQVGRMFAMETKCETLRGFLIGGEKLVPFKPGSRFRFVNAYGPCETMAYVCWHDVRDGSLLQPVGRPSGNTKLYIFDSLLRLLPPGAVGELGISGRQVGRGYLGLPEKTAEAFVTNPFSFSEGFERMYRTGDLARLLPSGDIEFIGRRDGQVKIRGFRVELTEVEEVVRRFPGVEDATVAALDEPGGGKYLAAYVAGKGKIDTGRLSAFVRAEKPAYMVPAVTVQLDAIPYNRNHKVDRRALPVPVRSSSKAGVIPPENETERRIYEIAANILGHEDFGVTSDLFDAGLTSIGALRFNVDLGKSFSAPVRISDIRENSTVRTLAAFLDSSKDEELYERCADYPLMKNQLGVFLDSGMDGETLRYNIPVLLRLSESVDAGRLCASVRTAINAHPYIKATLFSDAGGNVRVRRNDDEEPEVELISAESMPDASSLVKPFRLLGGRLYRAAVYVTPQGRYLFLDVHHIVADGTSLAILMEDINAAYEGAEPAPESFTGFEAALEEEKAASQDKYTAAEEYYAKLLDGCSGGALPEKCPEDAGSSACMKFERSFGSSSSEITAFCRENRITPNAFFNAVFCCVLSGFLHTDDVSYCTIYNGRNDSRLSRCFAMLVKTLPVRCVIDFEARPADFAGSVQKMLIDSMANDCVPFSELSSRYVFKSDLFFNYQGDGFTFDRVGGERAETIDAEPSEAKAPLSFEVFLQDGVYSVKAGYRADYFCREFISSFTSALVTAAEGFTREKKIGDVSILSEEEKAHFAVMNDTAKPFEHVPAHVLFERQAAATPDAIAVKTAAEALTFARLDEMANAVADSLSRLGAKSGDIVGLLMERSALVPVAEIGIMKAGCAFLPMLPSYPDDRLEFCMKDAGCRFCVCGRGLAESRRGLFSADKPFKALELEALISEGASARPDVPVAMDQPVYCIYTSGSTGTPKGVLLEHHNLSNFIQTGALCEVESRGSAILCMASISFDMSVTEIFFSLCMGKTVYIASEEEIHNPDMLLSAFKANGIDIMMMTPSFAWNLLSMPEFESALAGLKGIVLGAEAFQPSLLSRLKALNGGMLVQNGYGPTECTQVCSVKTLEPGCSITIGSPFANTEFFVSDTRGNLLPRYAVGELIICGEGVCRGYVNLPDKNAVSFTEINGLRAYRSGDLVRINRDNEAEFGGRADNQVKIRGFRIELDEIEAVMQAFDGITQARVVVRGDGADAFLAGYFTADRTVNTEELTAFMRSSLTYYMVPAALMQLEKMPMTANGKLDKKALPEIRPNRRAGSRRAPKKSLEEKILDLFKSVLSIDECFADDNFFETGGTSLSASKVVMQLKSDGYKIEYQDIFDHQSAAELADYLESLRPPETAKSEHGEERRLFSQDERIAELLKFNSMEYAHELKREPLGTVLLTGATGFLGVHILKALLDGENGRIICLMRKGKFDSLETRLKSSLVYYFEDDFKDEFSSRIELLEGDITDDGLAGLFREKHFDTLINCAACVKHYANDDSIEFVNVHGVENLIALTKAMNARMIQISTTSVPGAHSDETYRVNLKMPENMLFVIDDMNNQYCRSKYHAELKMLEAIGGGMRGKIIRVGNLMGRYSDGEFQTNMRTNAFLNGLRGFATIGKCPLSHATDPMKFSPIDCTAKAVVLLAGTNDCFTAFHADSRATFDEMKVIEAMNRCGIPLIPVSDEEYYADFYRMMGDPEKNEKVSALLTNDRPDMHMVETENRFTANILYRLGFSWPFIDDEYLEKVVRSLDELDFFFRD